MIGIVTFDILHGAVAERLRPDEMYGLLLMTYTVGVPAPRIYRVEVEGRNGSIDLSEWAGETFYGDRQITIKLRDMYEQSAAFIDRIVGQRCRIYFDLDLPGWYYEGRCEDAQPSTRRHVTDITLTFTCHPFRYPIMGTPDDYHATANGQPYTGRRAFELTSASGTAGTAAKILHQTGSSPLKVVISGIDNTVNAVCTLTVNGTDYVITENGEMANPPSFVPGENTVSLLNNGYAYDIGADISFSDKVI